LCERYRGQQPESLTLTEGDKRKSSGLTGFCTEDDEATLLTDEGPETEGTFLSQNQNLHI